MIVVVNKLDLNYEKTWKLTNEECKWMCHDLPKKWQMHHQNLILRGIWWSKHRAFIQGWSHIFRQTQRYRLNRQELTSDPRERIWATEMEFSQHKYTKITKCTQKKLVFSTRLKISPMKNGASSLVSTNWNTQVGMGQNCWNPQLLVIINIAPK